MVVLADSGKVQLDLVNLIKHVADLSIPVVIRILSLLILGYSRLLLEGLLLRGR